MLAFSSLRALEHHATLPKVSTGLDLEAELSECLDFQSERESTVPQAHDKRSCAARFAFPVPVASTATGRPLWRQFRPRSRKWAFSTFTGFHGAGAQNGAL